RRAQYGQPRCSRHSDRPVGYRADIAWSFDRESVSDGLATDTHHRTRAPMAPGGLGLVLDRRHFARAALPAPGLAGSGAWQRRGVAAWRGEPGSVVPALPALALALLCQAPRGLLAPGAATGSAQLCLAWPCPAGAFCSGLDRRGVALGCGSPSTQGAAGR